ncbi:hypothetical protein PHLCEN_2v12329 [Hermanssonia centrifuga]|uniref:Ubiquitin-like domain-containing protein n=1 Tax=Hermanssonia centrifuga TaxID=98765 RepID=A0A2R6NHV1_9APHY|nr:hypothetical protein PHLCEN_2v12329 [Hermanssonia centrifuga]
MAFVDLRVELPAFSYSFHVHVHRSWSVRDIKEEIMRCCPGEPRVDGQRIIWRGRFLRDEEKVQDVWKSRDDARIVHLSVHPSAWTTSPPIAPEARPAVVVSQSQQPILRRSQPAPQSAGSSLIYIVQKHNNAIHVLTHGHVPSSSSEPADPSQHRSFAVGVLQSCGWLWPAILDEEYPPASGPEEGLRYERIIVENQPYLNLTTPNTSPSPIQQHALKVLSHTFPLLSIVVPDPSMFQTLPHNIPYPLTPTANLNQHLQQLGLPALRLAPHQNPNQNPNDPNNPMVAEIRAIPLRALLMPLIMLSFRTFILMYFFSPSKRPLFGLILSAWILYETWGALRAVLGNDRPVVPPGGGQARVGDGAPGLNNQRGQPGQPQVAIPAEAGSNQTATRGNTDVVLRRLANMNLRREDAMLERDVPAPEPSLFHKANAFVALMLTTLHPAVWDRRRTALRRREGRLRTEANMRETPSTEEGNSEDAARTEARAQVVARHERRPTWVKHYVNRVQTTDWADDA